MNFTDFALRPELQSAVTAAKYETPTLIQEQAIPLILAGKDVVGQSKTGSGKTAAFALPVLSLIDRNQKIQCLVLTPTRELCYQVADTFKQFGTVVGARVASVYGGVSINPQIDALRYAQVVVGTPGRILDHLSQGTIDLSHIKFFILDEVDRMADMGFIDDVKQIISQLPEDRQTLLFSATMTRDVDYLIQRNMVDPQTIVAEMHVDRSLLNQAYYDIDRSEKFSLLVHLIKAHTHGLSLVFCGTRHEVDIVTKNLNRHNIHAMAIHGGMTQQRRSKSLDMLKQEHIDVLVATDVAARGLDIKNVNYVYNYDVPKTSQEYVHRIGRTARAGASGKAFTLLTQRDHENFGRVLDDRTLHIPAGEMPQFEKVAFKRHEDDGGRDGGFGDRNGGRSYGGNRGGGSRGGYGGERRSGDSERRSSRGGDSDGGSRGGFGGGRPMHHGHTDSNSGSGSSRSSGGYGRSRGDRDGGFRRSSE